MYEKVDFSIHIAYFSCTLLN